MTAIEAIKPYVEGKKVRRTIWTKGSYVQLGINGIESVVSDKVAYNVKDRTGTTELFSPLGSIDRFGYNKQKQWELFKD